MFSYSKCLHLRFLCFGTGTETVAVRLTYCNEGDGVYLSLITYVDQQGVRNNRYIKPDTISQNLQPTDGVIDHEHGQNAPIRVGLEAEHELRPRALRVVAESSVSVSLLPKLVHDIVVVEFQQPRHCPDQSVFHRPAFRGELVQKIPAKKQS